MVHEYAYKTNEYISKMVYRPISKYIHKNMHIHEQQTKILNSEHLNKQARNKQQKTI